MPKVNQRRQFATTGTIKEQDRKSPAQIESLKRLRETLGSKKQKSEIVSENIHAKSKIKQLGIELIRGTEELKEYRQIIQSSPDPILITNAEVKIIYVNKAWEGLTGYKRKEVIGKNPHILSSGKTPKHIFKQMWSKLDKKLPFTTNEIIDKRKDGTEYQIRSTFFPILKKNQIIFYVQIQHDITKQKVGEIALKEREKKYRLLLKQASDPILIHNTKRKIIDANDAACQMLGYTKEELLKMYAYELIVEEDKKLTEKAINKVKKGESVIIERRVIRKDGKIIPIEASSKMITPNLIESIIRDITERKQREQIQARYQAIFDSANDTIITLTPSLDIVSWNPAAEEMYGYSEEEIIGQPLQILVPKQLFTQLKKILKNLDHNYINFETQRITKSGKIIDIASTASLIKDRSGNLLGYSLIHRDITEKKKLDEMKRTFLLGVSHELKTPITTLKLFLQVHQNKLDKILEQKDRELFDTRTIDRELNRLTTLINDLLDISRFETGKVKLDLREIDLTRLVKNTIKKMRLVSTDHKILLNSQNSILVNGDAVRIEQVLVNLLNNAIKYSRRKAPIYINATTRGNKVIVSVQDRGIGISRDKLPYLFEQFYQVDKDKEGFGIGLFISKLIIESHKGKIWVKSEEGKGSEFFFSLPLAL